ncbi:MAG: glycosyltransferase family 2 protein [Candidatus Helarchaeota archaeon]
MKPNIVITSRNKPENINRLLSSFSRTRQSVENIIIIDDSTTKVYQERVKKVCKTYKDLPCRIVSSDILAEVKIDSKLSEIIKLGVPEWNLANGRNIGLLFSYALSEAEGYTIFLDDDITFPFGLNVKQNPKYLLQQIGLQGCPDFSRLEWIQFYIEERGKRSISDYVHKLYKHTIVSSKLLLATYTDLVPARDDEEKLPDLLQRQELSGGAFICSNKVMPISAFPSWFDEDWYWFHKIRITTNTTMHYSGFDVQHNSDRKVILNGTALWFEEQGKIMTEALKNYESSNITIDEALRRQHKQSVDKVNAILEQSRKIKFKGNIEQEIYKHLSELSEKLRNDSLARYVSRVSDFQRIDDLWRTNFIKTAELIYEKVIK